MGNLATNLKKHALERPDSIAVVHGERRISYGQLWYITCAIIKYMQDQGFSKGERVSILMQNSPEYIATYYAILAQGGVVVALNNAVKQHDLLNWLKHSGSEWLFADAAHPEMKSVLNEYEGQIILNNYKKEENVKTEIEDIVGAYDGADLGLTLEAGGADPAAIIYTSGTTGNPKGVTLSYANLVINTQSIIDYLRLTSADSIVNVLPFYYSYGNSILHTHIQAGGTIILANNMMYPKLILELIGKEKVTGFSGVSSTYALLLNRTNLGDYDLSSLRYMTQAGGPMPPLNISRLLDFIPGVKFYVMYGQTEATARLAYLPPAKLKEKMASIGIAIPGVELEIRDKKGHKAKSNEVGEIFARGGNIMLGYWLDNEKTQEVLVHGWLKTGDLAYYDQDDYLYIVGRKSEMIKTGANRVSPRDVEEVIGNIDGVEEVAVIGVPDEMLGQVIKAFVVRKQYANLDKREIMEYCKENLAIYKLPKHIVYVDEIPKTASGKIQRYKLK